MIDINQRQNLLLSALPLPDYKRLSAQLEVVHLPQGMVLCQVGGTLNYAYFPSTAIISLMCATENGGCAETAVIGDEGMLGVSVIMGAESTCSQAMVQSAGSAYRLNKNLLKQEFDRSGSVRHVLLRYTQTLITHMSQTAVCNRHHSVDQQFCRWLLQNLDRSTGNVLAMTHEAIANRLGVRREGITAAAGKLRSVGIISYNRGQITVLDREQLEDRSCECYSIVKNECDRLRVPAQTAAAA